MKKKDEVYAMYKGEECLGIGTKKELAELLKVNYKTICFYTSPTYKKRVRRSRNRRRLVYIGGE